MEAVLLSAMGIIGHFALVAILKLPSWNGRSSSSLSPLLRVPSGKIQIEIPDFTFSMASRIIFKPCLISVLSRKGSGDSASSWKAEEFFQLFFCYITGPDRTAGVGKKNVKKASVISNIKYRRVFGYVLFADDSDLHSRKEQAEFKNSLNNVEGTDVFFHWGKFSDYPFHDEKRDGENQKAHNGDADKNKSNHKKSFPGQQTFYLKIW